MSRTMHRSLWGDAWCLLCSWPLVASGLRHNKKLSRVRIDVAVCFLALDNANRKRKTTYAIRYFGKRNRAYVLHLRLDAIPIKNTMSFLNALIPVGTLTSLVEDICKQIDVGRLEVTDAPSKKRPTPELNQLVTLLGQKLNRSFKSHTLIMMDSLEDFYLDEVEGEKCIFCIRRNQSGPAIWTDMIRECRIEENNVSLIEEGYLHAEGDDGGIYLILWPLKEPEPEEGLAAQGPPEQRDNRQLVAPPAQHDAADKAIEISRARETITLEDCRKQLALWEKLDKEIRSQRKRGRDLMAADSAPEDAIRVYDEAEETPQEDMAREGIAELERRVKFLVQGASKKAGLAARNSISGPIGVNGNRAKVIRSDGITEVIPIEHQSNKRRKIRHTM
ncbi:hypothetical protein F5Y00DRAFT_224871 [Daldinia vernicosa]|uniref:uncharacterized protein n=1 Tax=Daldinia vernicosa TaxID=114800 RepID=UPI0020089BC6|nr:uncharacterized protein F5Y00DRAFT_224871 [Daldinia vernicosa]KAI0853520.1 hypothetical protein F5Y00DRAFT_224871 [Daldinia vernicosa]